MKIPGRPREDPATPYDAPPSTMRQAAPPPDAASAQDAEDARAFDDYARGQDAAQLQAALWATRRSQPLDAEAQARFQAWLAQDAGHAALYAEFAQGLAGVQALPQAQVQALKAGLRASGTPAGAGRARAAPRRAGRPGGHPGWGRWVPQLALVLLLVAGGWLGWDHWRGLPTFERDYATARGQQLSLELPDGSTLHLDAATRVAVQLYRQRREVRLLEGQALFAVSHRPQQPFDVLAGGLRVTVLGTRFSVRHTQTGIAAGTTRVAVESGRVHVAPAGPPQAAGVGVGVDLAAGQGVDADPEGRLEAVAQQASQGIAPWRQGRVRFEDAPLAQVLAEFERYGDTGLVLRDPALGALRLGGSFDLRQSGVFAQALPHLLPVRLERHGGVTEIVRQR